MIRDQCYCAYEQQIGKYTNQINPNGNRDFSSVVSCQLRSTRTTVMKIKTDKFQKYFRMHFEVYWDSGITYSDVKTVHRQHMNL